MSDRTPDRHSFDERELQLTPETPINPPLQFLIPSSLFRPWDTPESLSPTSSNVPAESLSPTSSNLAPSDTSSPPSHISPSSDSSANSSPAESSSEISPSQSVFGSNGNCLYRIQPLEPLNKQSSIGSFYDNKYDDVKHDNLDFISGAGKRSRKRRRKDLHAEAASPILSRKQRGVSRGDFPPCGVCGEESTGIHYGAAVCEGCKGFFRRRVVYRDVAALVCGTGGQCNVAGKGRIHCKLCRYNSCINIGMKPSAIKQEIKLPSHLTFEEQVLRCYKETTTPIPAVYLARNHTDNINRFVAGEWPQSADLGSLTSPGPGCADSLRFVQSLPGWGEMSGPDQQWSLNTGAVQVMLVRLLSRYRPEVGAFLFPCGQFLYPSQLVGSLSEASVTSLTTLAHNLASRGLTQQEMALVSALVATNPLTCSQLYRNTLNSISEKSSGVQLTDLAMQISELAWTSSPESWTNISVSQ